jgi:cytochrome c-type biogenesis protein CcmE
MTAGKKLAIGGTIVVAATVYMACVGLSDSWKYFLMVDECLDGTGSLTGKRVRVSGTVAPGTLVVATDRSQARFALAGTRGSLQVACSGWLPDNLAEGIEVVVEGRFEPSGVLNGDTVLTRCASKYETEDRTVATADTRSAGGKEAR